MFAAWVSSSFGNQPTVTRDTTLGWTLIPGTVRRKYKASAKI
jgi:hypothetical protein